MTKYQHSKLSNPFSRIWAEIKKMQNKRISQCDAVLKPMALAVMCDLPRESVTQNMPHFLCSLEVTFVFFPWSSLVQKHPCASLDGAIPKGLFSNHTVAVSTMTLRLGAFSWFFCWGKATAAWWERCWKEGDNLLKVEMLTKTTSLYYRGWKGRWVTTGISSWTIHNNDGFLPLTTAGLLRCMHEAKEYFHRLLLSDHHGSGEVPCLWLLDGEFFTVLPEKGLQGFHPVLPTGR